MKFKTSELIGPALDWAVAKADSHRVAFQSGHLYLVTDHNPPRRITAWLPSSAWAQGGPIIEREGMSVGKVVNSPEWAAETFSGAGLDTSHLRHGPTPLIAAMRCLVASKLGDEVEIPEELL